MRVRLKQIGALFPDTPSNTREAIQRQARLPRIRVTRPVTGWAHAVTPVDIADLLRSCGPTTYYGLRTIELATRPPAAHGLCFGRLLAPGHVVLYAQAMSPWTLLGGMADSDARRFRAYGATVTTLAGGIQTQVAWPGSSLRDFMLYDVLLHELGHHYVQQHTGKRGVRVLRTSDHERRANLLARRWRMTCLEGEAN